jgi:hypothetical protein
MEQLPKKWLSRQFNLQTIILIVSIWTGFLTFYSAVKRVVDNSVSNSQMSEFLRQFQKSNPSVNVPDFPKKSPDEKLPTFPFIGSADAVVHRTDTKPAGKT